MVRDEFWEASPLRMTAQNCTQLAASPNLDHSSSSNAAQKKQARSISKIQ
jgi:hypothetical protein